MTGQIMHPLGSRDYDTRRPIFAKGQKEGYPEQAPNRQAPDKSDLGKFWDSRHETH